MKRRLRIALSVVIPLGLAALGYLLFDQYGRKPVFEVHGHRGALGEFPPGNTMASFGEAIRQGAHFVEADLRTTKDGSVIANHDEELSFPCEFEKQEEPSSRTISNAKLEELLRADCHPHLPGRQPPATLKELLGMANEQGIGLNLELKPESPETLERTLQVIVEADHACGHCLREQITIQSFHLEHLKTLRREMEQSAAVDALGLRVSFLTRRVSLKKAREVAPFVDVLSPRYGPSLDEKAITTLHELGLRVIPWTVNSQTTMCELARDGADGVISDYPRLASDLSQFIDEHGRPKSCPLESGD